MDAEPEEHTRTAPLEARSSNHFTLAFTEFEFLIDFGQAYEETAPIIQTRIMMTPHSAKTLHGMLGELLNQYETKVRTISGGSTDPHRGER